MSDFLYILAIVIFVLCMIFSYPIIGGLGFVACITAANEIDMRKDLLSNRKRVK